MYVIVIVYGKYGKGFDRINDWCLIEGIEDIVYGTIKRYILAER